MTKVLLVTLFAAACTGSGSSDGAGDEIAPNRIEEPVGPEQRLSLVEELRIGSVLGGNEAEQLYSVKDIEIGPGGDIYALDGDEVRVFSPTEGFLRSWGREGEGPGEFQGPLNLALARDTVAVTDGQRVHFFDLHGRFLNSVWPGAQTGRYSVYTVHAADPGWVVEVRALVFRSGDPMQPLEVRYLDPGSGSLGESIVTYLRSPDVVQLSPGTTVKPAFTRSVDHGVDQDGQVYLSNGMDYEMAVYSAEGVLRRVITMDVDRIPITDAMIEQTRREEIEICQRPARRRMCERPGGYLDRGLPAIIAHANRENLPVFATFLVATDGHLLVLRADLRWNEASGAPRPYDLVSPEGRFLGRIDIPANIRPLLVRDQSLFGTWRDELGVPYIVKYRLDGLPG